MLNIKGYVFYNGLCNELNTQFSLLVVSSLLVQTKIQYLNLS